MYCKIISYRGANTHDHVSAEELRTPHVPFILRDSDKINLIQYQTPYPESLELKAFQILGFSEFWFFIQRNFNTDKINNKNYMLRYTLSTIHNLFFIKSRNASKIWGDIIFFV
jgi:hypothetical protein